ncbi:MAG TPA: HpcH/HpaI aldolase/citrate lyase family protein [Candidatus Baltobacteraceae bacterium]|nr:HpcH/HpaI aldolase/citrate lyase family protein [Candidatus Baltobacteraceae bacterium]
MSLPLPRNHFKAALREGRRQIGLWNSLCSNVATELVAGSGFDCLVLDMEHAPNDLSNVLSQLQALAPYEGVSAIVRPPWNDAVVIKRLLDAGAQTFLIPYVQNAVEAMGAVAATRYPPEGIRSVALATRANRWGHVPDYFVRASEELCVIVQLESVEALTHLEEITSVPGIDCVFIGPSDLSASLGHLGNPQAPEVRAAIDDAFARAKRAGKPAGILMTVESEAQRYLEEGVQFVAVGSDSGLLARTSEALAARFK